MVMKKITKKKNRTYNKSKQQKYNRGINLTRYKIVSVTTLATFCNKIKYPYSSKKY